MDSLYNIAKQIGGSLGSQSRIGATIRPIGEFILNLAYGRGGLEWTMNGLRCRINPKFRAQMATNYDAPLADYLKDKILEGQTCFDVGANIGAWVIQFAHAVGERGKVIAFEPNPFAREILEEHIRLNQQEGICTVVPAAVGAAAGNAKFFAADADGMSRLGQPNPEQVRHSCEITVGVITLDEWCHENAILPDWLLIDVEGFEGHVLTGAANMIRSCGANLGIIVEMHPALWKHSGSSGESIEATIAALGRHAIPLTGQQDLFSEYGHVLLASN